MKMVSEGPNLFPAVKGEKITDYYRTSLEKLKAWDKARINT